MSVLIAHATHNEIGKVSGGKPGDQTGQEVCIRAWYNRPWSHVLRFKDPAMREKFAYDMEAAANNDCIGYNQLKRNTCLSVARTVGYDLSRVKMDCDTDCSALVTIACIYAGIPETTLYRNGNSSTTSNLRARLKATGTVEIFASKDYTSKPDKLIRGDILLYEGHHVAGVVRTDKVVISDSAPAKSIEELAKEVIRGQWGVGSARKKSLTAAGYDYSEIQKAVNRIVRGEMI